MSKKNKKQNRFYSVREMTSEEAMKYLNSLHEFMEMNNAVVFAMYVSYQYKDGDCIDYSYN